MGNRAHGNGTPGFQVLSHVLVVEGTALACRMTPKAPNVPTNTAKQELYVLKLSPVVQVSYRV